MKKKLLPIVLLIWGSMSYAQVGIGTKYPDASAALDIQLSNRGILIPKVELKNIDDTKTINGGNPKEGLLVFNTNDKELQPGFYFWGKSGLKLQWIKVATTNDIVSGEVVTNESLKVRDENLVLRDSKGQEISIDLSELQKEDVITDISSKGDGVYVYTNEEKQTYVIDVVTDVQANFETIINNEEVKQILREHIAVAPPKGNVVYVKDGESYALKYTDDNDNAVTIPMDITVKEFETVTVLTPRGDGEYEYRNETQIKNNEAGVVIDVVADVQEYFDDIINDSRVQKLLNQFIEANPPKGNVVYELDGESPVFKYTDEGNNLVVIDMSALVKANETVTSLSSIGSGKYEYRNEDQIKNSEAGVVIDVVADVESNFEIIIKNEEVQKLLNQFIEANPPKGNVVYELDGESPVFKYTDEGNNLVVIDMSALVKANETVTSLSAIGAGKYEYRNEDQVKNSEAGVVIDVVADVESNFETIIKNEEVQKLLNQYITTAPPKGNVVYELDGESPVFKYTDEGNNLVKIDMSALVKVNETVTSLSAIGAGKYEYRNEDQIKNSEAGVVINVVADVESNFETIIKNEEVQKLLNQYITTAPPKGNVVYELDGESPVFKYTDEGNNLVVIDMSALVKANETVTLLNSLGAGKYEYRNENQIKNSEAGVVINVVADVESNFETIIKNEEVQKLLNQYITTAPPKGNVVYELDGESPVFKYTDESNNLVVIDMPALVKANETVTSLSAIGSGKYEYRNEDQIKNSEVGVVIDVVADVESNFETIIKNEEVQKLLNQYITTAPPKGNVVYELEGESPVFKYTDEGNNLVVIDMPALVKANETVTSLSSIGTGKYEYRNEDQVKNSEVGVVIDVVADVESNFETIIKNEEVQKLLNQYITTAPPKGNVVYELDGESPVFKYTDEGNNLVVIDMSALVKANETVTWMEHKVETVIEDTYEGEVEKKVHTLKYHGEDKDDPRNQVIKIAELIKGSETVTKLDYDVEKGTIKYYNEIDEVTEVPLKSLVKRYESKTNLSIDQDNKVLVFKSEDGEEEINLTSLVQEPWFISGTKQGATSNTQDIYTQGWVGIGYDKPSSAPNEKLRVNGSITATNSYYADYVFEKYFDGYSNLKYDYNFNNLKTVEDFIKENRHLPGITPITELRKEESGYSFNVSELSIQLLEKTEELYLHTIEQEKKITSLEGELQEVNERLSKNQSEIDGLKERLQLMEQLILNQSKK
ncbi:hypothetical protein [Myroides marinus]|uniref:hypothetical protein n=1 Tax=Myroides marinus TaxID=703342 RepID=UPI00257856D0|nr:hypothetical protein [Myroides marinus]